MKTKLTSMRKTITSSIALALGSAFVASTQAAVIIPEKSGFSGYINLGVGGIGMKSNMVASILDGNVDLGENKIDNLSDSPDSREGGAIPAANFELSYTFGSTRTQLHIGNLLENYLSMEMNTLVGVRQDIGNAGNMGASFQATSIDTQVWRDPYLTGSKRQDTDRSSKGFTVYWQQIMRSGLELKYATSEVDIDKERSGESLALTPGQRKLLDRNGDVDTYTMSYEFGAVGDRHVVTPALAYVDMDLDGQAMANDGIRGSVNYIFTQNEQWRYVFNVSYGDFDYKETNPIYAEEDSAERYGVSGTVFYSEPFGWKHWFFNATAGWYEEDHDIDFYDTEVGVFVLGMFRKF